MLLPKRVKYRRVHRGRLKGKASRGNFVAYGEYGLMATEPSWITSNQIEAARIAMTRYTKRGGKVWIKIFPDKPVTEKPAETRMGSGKGSPEYWVAVVKPGRVLFEIAGVSEEIAREALRLASHKLPCSSPARLSGIKRWRKRSRGTTASLPSCAKRTHRRWWTTKKRRSAPVTCPACGRCGRPIQRRC